MTPKPGWTPDSGTIGLIWAALYQAIAVSFGFVFVQAVGANSRSRSPCRLPSTSSTPPK